MGIEDRKKRRVLLKTEVVINGIVKAYTLDISEGGMYVHTQAEFVAGAVLELGFEIEGRAFDVKSAIQHTQPGVGIGVRFLNLPPEDSGFIRKFLSVQPDVVVRKEAAPGGREQRSILLVDDSAQSRAIYRSKLMGDGFNIVEAANGTDALKRLQESEFSLVILDLWMEGIDGFKLMQIMKMTPALSGIPVIVLSARATQPDLQKANALGARDFMTKMTTTPARLSEKVRDILRG